MPSTSFPSSRCKTGLVDLPKSDSKVLLLGVHKTIVHASRNLPPNGRYDFKVNWMKKKKTRPWYVILRPGLLEFLQAAKRASFQIFPFTTWSEIFTSQILDQIDPAIEIITHWVGLGSHDDMLKGRLLDRTVILDYKPKVYDKPWSNAIEISAFTGDATDVELLRMLSFFQAQENVIDLRNLLHISSGDLPLPGLPLPQTTRKTLFLDLDETLIHHVDLHHKPPDHYDFTTKDGYIKQRPGVERLLQTAVDSDYEIVIFTAGTRDYASPIIDKIDPKGLITHRLYRDSCKKDTEGKCVKDLALTGRSLDRCVIIDDKYYKVLQRENVVMVKPFLGNMQDTELSRLLLFFQMERRFDDLRDLAFIMDTLARCQELESTLMSVLEVRLRHFSKCACNR